MEEVQEDPGLAKVKAILTRLQRIDLGTEPGLDEPTVNEVSPSVTRAPERAAAPSAITLFDRKRAAIEAARPAKRSRRRIAVYSLAAAATLLIGSAVLVAAGVINIPGLVKTGASTPASAALTKEKDTALVSEARQLLSDGAVASARDRLLHAEPERRADAAFMLAQSFDPNYLRSLPKADSLPDRAAAEQWYKKWHELAVQSGLEMDNGRLQRIINSMR